MRVYTYKLLSCACIVGCLPSVSDIKDSSSGSSPQGCFLRFTALMVRFSERELALLWGSALGLRNRNSELALLALVGCRSGDSESSRVGKRSSLIRWTILGSSLGLG